MTIFKFPNPSFSDQINYKTARSGYRLERMGAAENMGSFAGVVKQGRLIWLRSLKKTQKYDLCAVETAFAGEGINVAQRDFVHPEDDILVRQYSLSEPVKLVYFADFDPTNKKTPQAPMDDWQRDDLLDGRGNDYAAEWMEEHEALVSFRPDGPPVYMAVGADVRIAEFQAGLERGATGSGGEDPFYDAGDGALSWNAACQGLCAIGLAVEGAREAAVFITAADSLDGALNLLGDAKEKGAGRILDDGQASCSELLDGVYIPREASSRHRNVLARAMGMEEETSRWQARAEELQEAIRRERIFPAMFPPPEPGAELRQSTLGVVEGLRRFIEMEPGEYAYMGMHILPAALILRDDADAMKTPGQALDVLLEETPTRDTGHYSEICVAVEKEGDRFFEQRNDIPANWSAASSYLAAVAVHSPELIEEALSRPVSFECKKKEAAQGCSCSGSPAALVPPFLLSIGGRRKKCRPCG